MSGFIEHNNDEPPFRNYTASYTTEKRCEIFHIIRMKYLIGALGNPIV